MQDKVRELADRIRHSKKTIFFGGAGTSTASGIPDFRSSSGLYQTEFEGMNPEVILSRTFFFDDPDRFYRFLKGHMHFPLADPNDCHLALAAMEANGLLHSVITQNIDDLHQRAGSNRVIELHGSLTRFNCLRCEKSFGQHVLDQPGTPYCECGGLLKPDVTLYEEMLDESSVEGAIEAISTAEVLIIGGTSLSVYPAASFIRYFKGNLLVVMNQTPTQADALAGMVFREPIDMVMKQLIESLGISISA